VRWFGDDPAHLLGSPSLWLADPALGADDPQAERHEIEGGGRGRAGEVRLKLRGVDDRDAAEALRGRLVLADEKTLAPLPEGEHYWFQLVGCQVTSAAGEPIGRVRELYETGAHDVLVVAGADGRDRLIPTARALLQEVDVAGRRIVLADLPGLTDPA
jgi:16S rRNA processing protein RimM